MDKVYEVLDSIAVRLGNPFLFSFAISWVATNWKVVFVLISSEDYVHKFKYIEGTLYAPDTHPLYRLLWYPTTSAVVYVLFVPLLITVSILASGAYEALNQFMREKVLKITMLSLDDSAVLRSDMGAIFEKLRSENKVLSTSIVDSNKRAGDAAIAAIKAGLPFVYTCLAEEAKNWKVPVKKMQHTSTVGTPEQDEIAKTYGLPEFWLNILNRSANMSAFSTQAAGNFYELDLEKTTEILLKLSSMNLLEPFWVDDELRFSRANTHWAMQLNGSHA